MKRFNILFLLIILISCNYVRDYSGIETLPETDFQNVDFLQMPYGQPESSSFKSLRWGNLMGNQKEKAKNNYVEFSIESEIMASKIVDGIDLTDMDDLHQSLPILRERIAKMRSENDTFLTEQYIAFKIQRVLYNNQLFTVDDIEQNKNIEFVNNELDILEFSVELLVENGNPNTELIALNVFHLNDHTEKNKLQTLARRSIANANSWFSLEQECLDCSQNNKIDYSQSLKKNSINAGIQYLSQF